MSGWGQIPSCCKQKHEQNTFHPVNKKCHKLSDVRTGYQGDDTLPNLGIHCTLSRSGMMYSIDLRSVMMKSPTTGLKSSVQHHSTIHMHRAV